MCMASCWQGICSHELACFAVGAQVSQLNEIFGVIAYGAPASTLSAVAAQLSHGRTLSIPSNDVRARFRFSKLALLVHSLEAGGYYGSPEAVLEGVERFVIAGQRWLKIAGGSKAELLEVATQRRQLTKEEVCVEFGCFVGYTAVRLGSLQNSRAQGRTGTRVVSCEFELVHVRLSQYSLGLARLSHIAEVWPGHVPLITPRFTEAFGSYSAAFQFMDHKGTRFHEDRRHFEALKLYSPGACVVCDNVVHPGAPEYLWAVLGDSQHCCWSLEEFAQLEDLEDWQSVHDDDGGPLRKI